MVFIDVRSLIDEPGFLVGVWMGIDHHKYRRWWVDLRHMQGSSLCAFSDHFAPNKKGHATTCPGVMMDMAMGGYVRLLPFF